MSKLLDFYTHILNAGSMIVDENGLISAQVANATTPQSVGGKRLVLPTKEYMAKQDKSEIVLFNPLHENIMRGESEVMTKFRGNANLKLNYTLQTLLGHLLVIASSTGLHSQLKPDQFELISILKDVDEKTNETYKAIVKAMPLGNIEKCFVHIYIKKGANLQGKNHRRGAIVVFPLYEEITKAINDGVSSVYGVKMRKRDLATFRNVLEKLFPGIAEANSYSRGSVSDTAPTLDALLQAVMSLASGINEIVDDYGHILEQLKDLRYNDEWVNDLNDLEKFAIDLRLTPMQAGNEGTLPVTQAAPVIPQQIQNVAPAPVAPVQQQWIPQQQQPVYAPQQPAYGAPAPTPAVVTTSTGKLDFAESVRRSPQLAAMAPAGGYGYGNPYQPAPPPGPMTSRMGVPAFMQPSGPMQMGYPNGGYPQYGGYPQQNGYAPYGSFAGGI